MKKLERAYRDLMDWMVAHPVDVLRARQEIQEQLVKRRCVQGDSTLQTTLMPLFLKRASLERIRQAAETLDGVIDKTLRLHATEPSVREAFPPHLEVPAAWIDAPVGYPKPTVLNRLDILFNGETLQFIEFNTDNPGGRGWCDTIDAVFSKHPLYRDLIDFSDRSGDRPILTRQMDAVMECWRAFGRGGDPRVAFLSFDGMGSRGDDEICRDFFVERGIEANLIDPRDFELQGGRLKSNGVAFDLAIRTMTSPFFLRYPRELADFHQAVARADLCMVNSFRATLGSQKALLSFLTNPLNHHHFSEEEARVLREHVPWTRRFDETVTLSPEGEEVSIKAYMLHNREKLVIKPSAGAGGYGVMVGPSTDPLVWREAIEDSIGAADWVVQSYVEIPKIELPVIQEGKVKIEERFFNLSPYVFGGKLAGILGRVSSNDVVNVHTGGGLIPVFPLKDEVEAPTVAPKPTKAKKAQA